MGAPDILTALHRMGLNLSVHGADLHVSPRARITEEARRLIREHKAELLKAVDTRLPADMEARRQRVLAMLAHKPGIRYALIADPDTDPEAAIVALAIRGIGTCELRIPREKFDPFLLIDLVERQSATLH